MLLGDNLYKDSVFMSSHHEVAVDDVEEGKGLYTGGNVEPGTRHRNT